MRIITKPQSDNPYAFYLYILLTLSILLRLTQRVPELGALRFDLLIAALTLGLIFTQSNKIQFDSQTKGISNLIIFLLVYSLVALPFTEWPGSVLKKNLTVFIKAILFFFFTAYTITSVKRLKIFITVYLGCQIVRVLEPLYLNITSGYWGSNTHLGGGEFMARLAGGPYDIVNPNGLAYIIASVFPFLYYLLLSSKKTYLKLCFFAITPLLLYALILTSSRSGLIALVFILFLILRKSKYKFFFLFLCVAALPIFYSTLSDNQKDRYLSIFSSNTKGAETSQGRKDGVVKELKLGLQRPIFGHGLGTSAEAKTHKLNDFQIAHNLYTEILIELGLIGLFIFILLLIRIIRSVKQAIKMSSESNKYLNNFGHALQVWMYMNLLFSMASYGLNESNWYLFAGLSVCLVNIIKPLKQENSNEQKA